MSTSRLIQHIRKPPRPPVPILACSKVFACILPIVQIAIGSVYLHECPRQRYIPIYLIVSGIFGLMLAILSCLPCIQESDDGPQSPLSKFCTIWNSITSLFIFCWFITGNVWVYTIYQPNYNKTSTDTDPYCDKTLYLFTFWTMTLLYIILGLFLIGGCCVFGCLYLCGRADPDDDL